MSKLRHAWVLWAAAVLVGGCVFAGLLILANRNWPVPPEAVGELVFPPKDQDRFSNPPVIRRDVYTGWETRRVAL